MLRKRRGKFAWPVIAKISVFIASVKHEILRFVAVGLFQNGNHFLIEVVARDIFHARHVENVGTILNGEVKGKIEGVQRLRGKGKRAPSDEDDLPALVDEGMQKIDDGFGR